MIDIARIQAWALRSPVETPVQTSFGVMRDRPAVLVRVEDRDGAFGWGEIFANWPAAGAEHRVRLLEHDIAPLVLGQVFASPDALFHELSAKTRIRAVQCGESGPFAQVIAGLDIALWDLAARLAGLPLRRFIRPDAPDTVPAYASGIQIAAAPDEIPKARLDGHQRFKLKVGFAMDQDVDTLSRVSQSLQSNEQLACDANQAWDLEQSKDFVRRTENISMMWLEEPMPVFAEASTWKELSEQAHVPLAGGENIAGDAAFDHAICQAHLRVIQPDVAKWGGMTGCLGVARKTIAAGLRYCPHFLGAGVGLAASAELLAAVGGDGLLELDVNPNPLRSVFFDGGDPVSEGCWDCTQNPGLGIEALPVALTPCVTHQIDLPA